MWHFLTYIYNSILVLFIAVHLLVGAFITFLVGLYCGIYMCQNYEIPKIDEPLKLWTYFVNFLEGRRKPGGLSIFRLASFKSKPSQEIPQPSPNSSRDNLAISSSTRSRGSSPLPSQSTIESDKNR